MNKELFIQKMMLTSLEPYAEQLAVLMQPAIGIEIRTADNSLPTGASKFGGLPDAPAEFLWPEKNGIALAFLAQIRLADITVYMPILRSGEILPGMETLAPEPLLPSDGLLSFFYDAYEQPYGIKEHFGSWRVLYFAEETSLVPAAAPPNLLQKAPSLASSSPAEYAWHTIEKPAVFPQHAVQLSAKATWPDWEEPSMKDIEFSKEAKKEFCDMDYFLNQPENQLLGMAQPVQGDVRAECQVWAKGLTHTQAHSQGLLGQTGDWQLLLQIGSESAMGWQWGDAGRIYFMIRRADLRERRFEKAWLILQCS